MPFWYFGHSASCLRKTFQLRGNRSSICANRIQCCRPKIRANAIQSALPVNHPLCPSRFHANFYISFGYGEILSRERQLHASIQELDWPCAGYECSKAHYASFRYQLRDIFLDGQSYERSPKVGNRSLLPRDLPSNFGNESFYCRQEISSSWHTSRPNFAGCQNFSGNVFELRLQW